MELTPGTGASEKGVHNEASPPGKGPGHLCSEGLRFHIHRNHLKLSRESATAPMTRYNTSQKIVPCERKYGHLISKSPLQSSPNPPPKPLCLSKMGLMCGLHVPTWPWDLDSGNMDSKAEGDMWRTSLGDRAGSKQSSAIKRGTKMGLHAPHIPQAKSLLLGCHHPA